MTIPDVRVEVAFGSQPGDATQAWTDVTQYVLLSEGVSITRGRSDEFSQVQPSTLSLTLDNSDGRFTAGLSSSPYYPNVKIGKQIRVFTGSTGGNLLQGDSSTFEGGTVGTWSAAGFPVPTVAVSTTRAWQGTRSLLVTWPTGASPSATLSVSGLPVSTGYVISAYVYAPAGSPDPVLSMGTNVLGLNTSTSTKGAWVRMQAQFSVTGSASPATFNISPATSSTSGQQVWIDAIQIERAATASTFTTTAPLGARFTGYVDEWPTSFAPVGKFATASVTATDRMKRLGQIAEFKNVAAQEILYDTPAAYYMLGEDSGSIRAGDVSGNGCTALAVTQLASGGTIEFAAGTGPGTDGLSAPIFTPASTTSGKYLTAVVPELATITFAPAWLSTIRASFNTSTSAKQTIVRVASNVSSPDSAIELRVTAAGKLEASCSLADIGAEVLVTSSTSVVDGATHDAEASFDGSLLRLYLDGSLVGSVSAGSTNGTSIRRVSVGGYSGGQLFTGTIAHVAVFSVALDASRIAQHASVVLQGASGESSDSRIARYARWAGISSSDYSLEAGASTSIAHVDTTGVAPLTVMQDVATTEGGILFISGDGELTFHARSHRYNAPSALTLTDIGVGDTFVVNDQQLANDVTASRSGGITYRAVSQDSVNDYGPYRQSITLLTTSDDEVASAAQWQAFTRSDPEPRLSSLTIDLLTDSTIRQAALALELGSRVTLPTLPAQAPDSATDVFIEGWTETVSTSQWWLVCNTSPAAWSGVWALDSAQYSVLGTSTRLAY